MRTGNTKQPEVAHTEWMLGWAEGYHAALRGDPSPWKNDEETERRIHPGRHWEQGYKEGYDRARDQKDRGVKVQTSAQWE